MGGLEALGAMLAASVGLFATKRSLAPSNAEARACLRSALFFAWGTLAGEIASGLARGSALVASVPPLDGVVTATLTFGTLGLVVTRLPPRRRALGGVVSVAVSMGVERLLFDTLAPDHARLAMALSLRATWAWLGVCLLRWMLERRHAIARAVLHAVAFGSTLAFLAPLAVLHAVGRTPAWPSMSAARSSIAGFLATGALALGIASARAFVKVGGTPDPLDPPPRLVTDGVYAHVRHPLQVAEVILLAATAIAFWDRWVLLYVVASSLALVGPVRLLEEAMLERRFGDEAVRYGRHVPAFLAK